MKESTIFPLPWKAVSRSESGNEYDTPIAVVAANGQYVAYHGSPGCFLNSDHALLFAASPDLYAACDQALTVLIESCVAANNSHTTDRDAILAVQTQLRNALMKANP